MANTETHYLVFDATGNSVAMTANDEPSYPRLTLEKASVRVGRETTRDRNADPPDPIPFEARGVEQGAVDSVLQTEAEKVNEEEVVKYTVTDSRTGEVVTAGEIPFEALGFSLLPPPTPPSEVRNDIERDIIEQTGGKTLWRVGTPRISDVWLDSFSSGRGSGGMGAGVYGYVTREGAERDSSSVANPNRRDREPQPVIALRGALENPLIVSGDLDKTIDIHHAGQFLSKLAADARDDGDAISRYREEEDYFRTYPESAEGLSTDSLYSAASTLDLRTLGQREGTFLPDSTEGWAEYLLDACEEAAKQRVDRDQLVQPMNVALRGAYDGIYPTSDAGGDSNRWGAVIFKGKIDRAVGRTTRNNENLDPEVLNEQFSS